VTSCNVLFILGYVADSNHKYKYNSLAELEVLVSQNGLRWLSELNIT